MNCVNIIFHCIILCLFSK